MQFWILWFYPPVPQQFPSPPQLQVAFPLVATPTAAIVWGQLHAAFPLAACTGSQSTGQRFPGALSCRFASANPAEQTCSLYSDSDVPVHTSTYQYVLVYALQCTVMYCNILSCTAMARQARYRDRPWKVRTSTYQLYVLMHLSIPVHTGTYRYVQSCKN